MDINTASSEIINPKKLTEWANEPTLKDLKQDYTDALSDHSEHEADVINWLDNLNIEGKAKVKKLPGRSAIVPKLIRKQAEWRYAALSEPFLSTDDIYNISPIGPSDVKAARQNAIVLNNQFNTKLDKIRFIDEYVRTAVDEGTVIVRTGWAFEEELQDVEVPVMEMAPTQDPQIQQMYQQIQANPSLLAQAPPEIQEGFRASMLMQQMVIRQQVGVKIEKQMVTTKNQPTADICAYTNIMVDPTCKGDVKKAQFVIYKFETSMSTLKKDGKYKNLEDIDIEANSILGSEDGDSDTSFNFTDKPRKKFFAFEYWGYWDTDDTGVVKPFVATWTGDTIIRMEDSPFSDNELPFVIVQYLPVRKKIYGEPDGELLEDNQKVIGAVTRGMIDIMARSANGQQGSRKDALDLTNQRRFEKGDDYQFNQTVSPQEAFYMHTFPEIPQSAGLMLQLQNNEAESLTGVKAFNSGITGTALGDNATGIRSAMDATSKRELGILRRLAEGMKDIGRKIIAMNGEFLNDEEVIRISEEEFVPVKRDDLQGNFDLALSISTAEADNDKAQELAFMLQTNGPNSDPGEARMIRAEIARLRKMPALAKQIEEYKPPPPDPMDVKLKELEIVKLEAEIREIDSKTAENYAEATLDNSAARNKDSDTDLKNLDFVEQETGTKQERDKELQGEQARANMVKDAASHVYNMSEESYKQRIGETDAKSK